jgi:hypothetical protein
MMLAGPEHVRSPKMRLLEGEEASLTAGGELATVYASRLCQPHEATVL